MALQLAMVLLALLAFGGDRDLVTPGYAPAGAMITRQALAGPTRF